MIDTALLQRYAQDYGVTVTDDIAARFDRYAEILCDWNSRMNLTAIKDPDGILLKHFVDSLTILPLLPKKKDLSLIDVGTGAGFPGIPLALLRDDIHLTLLDSLNKRLLFLQEVCAQLSVPVKLVHARAEEAGQQPAFREQFDVATARAVAGLPVLCEYCLPFVRVGGTFIAMKGPDAANEMEAAAKAERLLGGTTDTVLSVLLPKAPQKGEEPSERRIISIKKSSSTPAKFPRPSAKIAKQPW